MNFSCTECDRNTENCNNCDELINCQSCNYCYWCKNSECCTLCDYCSGCTYCYSCYYCTDCYYCYGCKNSTNLSNGIFCKKVDNSCYMIFCHEVVGTYHAFNKAVTEERYKEIVERVIEILPNWQNCAVAGFWQSVTPIQWRKIKEIPEFDGAIVEKIIAMELPIL